LSLDNLENPNIRTQIGFGRNNLNNNGSILSHDNLENPNFRTQIDNNMYERYKVDYTMEKYETQGQIGDKKMNNDLSNEKLMFFGRKFFD